MSALDGFKVFDFSEGVPYASVTFNKAVVMKMNYPTHVILLFDATTKRMALQVCEEDTSKAVEFYKPKKSNAISVRWNSKDLLNTIESIAGWDLQKAGYKVEGKIIKEENVIIFDLSAAKIMK